MVYWILKHIVYRALHVFYKPLKVKGLWNLAQPGPFVICPNHTNAFIDPIFMNVFLKQKVYGMARGDVFNTPLKVKLRDMLAILPLYRIEEGADQLHKNDETFEVCFEKLKERETLLLFPEAICVQEKRIRKLRKGTARIVFGAEERNGFNLNVRVVPVGINYSDAKKFRSSVFINIGQPIEVKKYESLYKANKPQAIKAFNDDLYSAIRSLSLHVNDPLNDVFFEQLGELYRYELALKRKQDNSDVEIAYELNKEIVSKINSITSLFPEKTVLFREKVNSYFEQLKALNLRDHLLRKEAILKINVRSVALDYLLLVLGFPLHLLGLILNYPPYKLAYASANKLVKHVVFYSSINFAIGLFTWLVYYLMLIVVFGFVSKSALVILALMIFIPLLGLYSLNYHSMSKKILGRWRLLGYVQSRKKDIEQLLVKRQELVYECDLMFDVNY